MPWTIVADIRQGEKDAAGVPILSVYARQPPLYAVYRTSERVMVHFADDAAAAIAQRASIVRLNPFRGEINSVIDGWHISKHHRQKSAALRYDRRVADALGVALEGDVENGLAILAATRADIVDERTSTARLQYLAVASGAAAGGLLLGIAAYRLSAGALLTASSGAIGAFFSIALAIRTRTVLTDLHFRNNAIDALLRVVIGLIAAAVLYALDCVKVVSVFPAALQDSALHVAFYNLLMGFLAGFSERLIPDLLAKIQVAPNPPPPSGPLPGALAAAAPSAANPPVVPATATAAHPDPDTQTDHCLCGHPISAAEATSDAELPAAAGGVAGA